MAMNDNGNGATTWSVEWAPGRVVDARLAGVVGSGPLVLLAHGAGAGQDHPFMAGLRQRLAAAGHATVTFDYPYTAEGRRAPDRAGTLEACHSAVLATMLQEWPEVVLAGKSMGGRIGSHLASECAQCVGLVFFGYSLAPPGKAPRPTDHLSRIDAPMLFIQGERDRLAPLDLLRPIVESLGSTIEVIPSGDHSFRVPKRVGIDAEVMLDHLAVITTSWLADLG